MPHAIPQTHFAFYPHRSNCRHEEKETFCTNWAYASPVNNVNSNFKPCTLSKKKLAEEEVNLSMVRKLLQTIVDASIDFNLAFPRAPLKIFGWSPHKCSTTFPGVRSLHSLKVKTKLMSCQNVSNHRAGCQSATIRSNSRRRELKYDY